jgi:hypothetical protein
MSSKTVFFLHEEYDDMFKFFRMEVMVVRERDK